MFMKTLLSIFIPRSSSEKFTLVHEFCSSMDSCCAVVITTTQLHSTKPEFRFCAGSNSARGVSDI